MLKIAVVFVSVLAIHALALSPMDCDPIHEEFRNCSGTPTAKCEMTCENFRTAKNQACGCVSKCVCKQQYVKNTSGKCVYRFQCPNSWWPWTSN